MSLSITSMAAAKVRQLLQEPTNADVTALRVYVQGGGCSGYQYGFSFEAAAAEDDIVIEQDGVPFLIDAVSNTFLEGAQLDYCTDGFNSYFSITNPNAKTTCGCGSSFAA